MKQKHDSKTETPKGSDSAVKTGAVEVLSKDGVHSDFLRKTGAEIISDSLKVAGKYLALVQYIRREQVSPKLVSFELANIGFARTRISEINRIANAADAVFSQFEAGSIGLKKTLELTRGNVVNLTKQLLADSPDPATLAVAATAEQLASHGDPVAAVKPDGAPVDETDASHATATINFNKHAMGLLREAIRINARKKTWYWEGLMLSLSSKSKKKIPAAGSR